MQSRKPGRTIYVIGAVGTTCMLALLPNILDAKAIIPRRGYAPGGLQGLVLLCMIGLGWFVWIFLRDVARKAKKKGPL